MTQPRPTPPTPPRHDHVFGQDRKRPGESRTIIVIVMTATMMVVEIVAGIAFGSMALLADGLHMASHAAALGITATAYVLARRHAHDSAFSFGTGKFNALGGYTGAVLLALFAFYMAWESIWRLAQPVAIEFDQAIAVAVAGLIVNGVSIFVLGDHHGSHDPGSHDAGSHDHHDHHDHHQGDHDHNLRAAYLHVLADALTSVLAIIALSAGKFYGLHWLDPVMGMVGAFLVARWSVGLVRLTSGVLLDRQAPPHIVDAVRTALEADGETRVADLHVWSIGPGIHGVVVSLATERPADLEHYRRLVPEGLGLVHCTIEVVRAGSAPKEGAAAVTSGHDAGS